MSKTAALSITDHANWNALVELCKQVGNKIELHVHFTNLSTVYGSITSGDNSPIDGDINCKSYKSTITGDNNCTATGVSNELNRGEEASYE